MTYLMDSAEEGRRIERKTDRALTLEQLNWAGVSDGSSVLDVGCAAGTTSRMMALIVGGSGRVVGVDASASRLAEAMSYSECRERIVYRQGDAVSIPASDGEFDLSWSRFLFEYLSCPTEALVEMIRVTRAGGTVCVSDLDGNCVWHAPTHPSLRAEINRALVLLRDEFNPRIGLFLYSMFVDAGLHNVAVDVRPYHMIAGRIDCEREAQWQQKLDGVAVALVKRGWSEPRCAKLVADFMSHLRDPRTLTYSTLFTVRGTVGVET